MMYYISALVSDTAFGGSATGCDSITNQQLTINNTVTVIPTAIVGCDSLSYNGMMYYISTLVSDTVFGGSATGCDSITNQQLTINNTVTVTPTAMVGCDSLSYNGMMYYISALVSDTAFGGSATGCDSITNQQITIDVLDITVTNASPILTANESRATYRWLDCDNGNAVIPSETNQSYTATVNGNYAVEVTFGSCVDTSACESVTGVGINELSLKTISIYPNPTKGLFTISLDQVRNDSRVIIYSVVGKEVVNQKIANSKTIINLKDYDKGIYFVKIQNGVNIITKRIVKH
jgi:hypothetical protein